MSKTDECIKMLKETQIAFEPILYSSVSYFDKNHIIEFQDRTLAMLDYRLLPSVIVSMPDDAKKETAKANSIMKRMQNFDAFWYAKENYILVTTDDLKNEFWDICPDTESISKFLDVMRVKFGDVNRRYESDLNAIKDVYSGLGDLVKSGIINEQEYFEMQFKLHLIAERYNSKMNIINGIYREFRKMKGGESPFDDHNPLLKEVNNSECDIRELYTELRAYFDQLDLKQFDRFTKGLNRTSEQKGRWLGNKNEAMVLVRHIGLTAGKWIEYFYFKDEPELKLVASHLSKITINSDLTEILEKYPFRANPAM